MQIQILIVIIFRIEAIEANKSEHSKLCCPKMDTVTLTKSCAVCGFFSSLNTKPLPFRIKAACLTLARYQCCPTIELENPEKLEVPLKRVSMLKTRILKNLHLI